MKYEYGFVDMDGVLCDFTASAMRVNGGRYDPATYPRGQWNIDSVLGITEDQFWRAIDADPDFWVNLEPFSWCHAVVLAAQEYCGSVRILTTPSQHPHSSRGKREWRIRHCIHPPTISCELSSDKGLLGAPGRLLIDDSDKNVAVFRAAGGDAILLPQPWNANHEHYRDPLAYVLSQLEAAK